MPWCGSRTNEGGGGRRRGDTAVGEIGRLGSGGSDDRMGWSGGLFSQCGDAAAGWTKGDSGSDRWMRAALAVMDGFRRRRAWEAAMRMKLHAAVGLRAIAGFIYVSHATAIYFQHARQKYVATLKNFTMI